jgi:hypothetical protein
VSGPRRREQRDSRRCGTALARAARW